MSTDAGPVAWGLQPEEREFLRARLADVLFLDGSKPKPEAVERMVAGLEQATREWHSYRLAAAAVRDSNKKHAPALAKLVRAIDEIAKNLEKQAPGFPLLAQHGLTPEGWRELQIAAKRTRRKSGKPRDDSRYLLVCNLVGNLAYSGVRVSKSRTGPIAECMVALLKSVDAAGAAALNDQGEGGEPSAIGHLLSPAVTTAEGFALWLTKNPKASQDEKDRVFLQIVRQVWDEYREARRRR